MKKSLVVVFLLLALSSCSDNRERIGEDIYFKIIQYQKSRGRLPERLVDLGIEEKMEGPVYYKKQTDSTFIIYYSGGLGESIVFDPETKKWKSDKQ